MSCICWCLLQYRRPFCILACALLVVWTCCTTFSGHTFVLVLPPSHTTPVVRMLRASSSTPVPDEPCKDAALHTYCGQSRSTLPFVVNPFLMHCSPLPAYHFHHSNSPMHAAPSASCTQLCTYMLVYQQHVHKQLSQQCDCLMVSASVSLSTLL